MADKIGCPYCGVELSKGGIKKHIHSQHKNEFNKKFKCKSCDSLHDASYGKGQFCSEFCSKNKNQAKITNIKMKDISKENTFKDGKYCCPECDSSYLKYTLLTRHVFKKHVEKTGICEKCGVNHDSSYSIGRFCSQSCANSNIKTEEQKKYMSNKIKGNILMNKTFPIDLFITLKNKYPFYNYSKIICFSNSEDINVICRFHGKFRVNLTEHLNGKICLICKKIERANKHILEFNIKHNYKYTYIFEEILNIKNIHEKITITCPKHGSFKQKGNDHKYISGCSSCATYGFDNNKKGILYYVKVETEGETLYKIGITNLSVKERFGSDFKYITIIKEFYYEYGNEAYDLEQEILKEYSYAKYNGEPILKSGNTELFTHDILGWDSWNK